MARTSIELGLRGDVKGLVEICFGCGQTRKVDLAPRWEHEFKVDGIEDWTFAFCPKCGPRIADLLLRRLSVEEAEKDASLKTVLCLREALGRESWLEKHSSALRLSVAVTQWGSWPKEDLPDGGIDLSCGGIKGRSVQ
jgi:hypothetical protein